MDLKEQSKHIMGLMDQARHYSKEDINREIDNLEQSILFNDEIKDKTQMKKTVNELRHLIYLKDLYNVWG
jgi:hypothetical protein